MPWPEVTHNEDGTASVVLDGQMVKLGPLALLDGDKTAIILRLVIEMDWELSRVPQNAAKIAALRNLLGQLRGSL